MKLFNFISSISVFIKSFNISFPCSISFLNESIEYVPYFFELSLYILLLLLSPILLKSDKKSFLSNEFKFNLIKFSFEFFLNLFNSFSVDLFCNLNS